MVGKNNRVREGDEGRTAETSTKQRRAESDADDIAAVSAQSSSSVWEIQVGDPTHQEIAARAYECWQGRQDLGGTAEDDWHQAERELRSEREHGTPKAYAAGASSI